MGSSLTTRPGRVVAGVLAVLALGGALAGCSADPLAEQYRAGDDKGFIAADGLRVVEIPQDERGEPVAFSGELDTGGTITDADVDGDVVVVNFWYAACGPCRAEAPALEEAYTSFAGDDVSFLGVNTTDSAGTALAFAETYGVTYPSVLASVTPEIKLAFAQATPISATPTTLVLDTDGRVAARIIGQLQDASVLETLVSDALAETS
ncbi:TlpA family protein disulfide reductase [Microbacterium xanthum]|uniref:TlpA family protein disulfide reductase n=1 Tax=Microbacterium xanthum TaxID=3079794 RepID=UPI002AD46FEE|nr:MULTISPECIES: TlpA disulfide reductase family protein [unclassified Microbacterium]MDZ8171735.1 TlpA disulfide reductase family protein [Microbacterium sp. KSW-48]MDZ8200162.1 TlpA disulfide reductase family protein [Microbacterium sp. SSW1-59]